MELTYIGTGEAFDPNKANSSYLLEQNGKSMMVDCGFTAWPSLAKLDAAAGRSFAHGPDKLLITHYHGDHVGGISALLMSMWEEVNGVVGTNKMGLDRKLEIISANPGVEEMVQRQMMDYPGFLDRMKKEGPHITYTHLQEPAQLLGWDVTFAKTQHGLQNYAYRFDRDGSNFAISGDGQFTDQSKSLFAGVDHLVHEGFFAGLKVKNTSPNHASIMDVHEYAKQHGVQSVSIVHVNRDELKFKHDEIVEIIAMAKDSGIDLRLPQDHDSWKGI